MGKQLDIQTHGGVLEATYRWRSPKAYFLVFFCLFWDGFLIFWYGAALSTGVEDPMVILFPLIHVAVGVGLTYYTICLLFNTSLIRVDREQLTIQHGPIPWWRGNRDIPIHSIKQLFVQERRHKNKGRVSYTYRIRVLQTNGKTETLFNVDANDSEDMRRLESAIEQQLQIVDQRMDGEFFPTGTRPADSTSLVAPRPIEPSKDPFRPEIQHASREDFVTLREREYVVTHHIQYDWNNGHTDRQLQLSGPEGQLTIYINQELTHYQPYETRQLDAAEQAQFSFSPAAPPREFENGDETYRLALHQVGHFFPDHLRHQGGIPVEQWTYQSTGLTRFRFVHYQGMTELFIEEVIDKSTFTQVLKPH